MDSKLIVARKIAKTLSPLSDNALEKFASILVRTELKKNTLLLEKGQVCNYIYFVERGMLRHFFYKKNKQLTVHFSEENRLSVCMDSFLSQQPTYLYMEAIENSVVYGIHYEPFTYLASQDREIEILYRKILETLLKETEKKIETFRFETANQRYQTLMLDRPELVRRAPLNYIASYLLMTKETLSRVRSGAFQDKN